MAEQRTYLIAVIRNGVECLEGQMVRAATAAEVTVGDRIDWPASAFEGKPQRVSHEVVEVRDATEHVEPVVVLRRSDV